jgi:hypothetical protein
VIFNIGCEASGRKIRRLGEEQYRYPVLEVQKFDLIFQSFRLMNMTYTIFHFAAQQKTTVPLNPSAFSLDTGRAKKIQYSNVIYGITLLGNLSNQ